MMALAACMAFGTPGAVLAEDDFRGPPTQWVMEYKAGPHASVHSGDGALVLDVDAGATAWLRQPLSGNMQISFKRTVRVEGERNDRLSDLNLFWMASDPREANLFTRSGVFEEYDNVRMYYLGIGGNTNSTTRLRRYDGDGQKRIIGEFVDAAHLLRPNHEYRIEIALYDGCTRVRVDGETWFQFRDPEPLRSGWFGIRTTQSRQDVRDLRIQTLK